MLIKPQTQEMLTLIPAKLEADALLKSGKSEKDSPKVELELKPTSNTDLFELSLRVTPNANSLSRTSLQEHVLTTTSAEVNFAAYQELVDLIANNPNFQSAIAYQNDGEVRTLAQLCEFLGVPAGDNVAFKNKIHRLGMEELPKHGIAMDRSGSFAFDGAQANLDGTVTLKIKYFNHGFAGGVAPGTTPEAILDVVVAK